MKSLAILQSLPRRTVLQDARLAPQVPPPLGWKIFESGTAFDESVASFATRREAEADGQKAMRLLVTLRRSHT
jgi:hypothetical protein